MSFILLVVLPLLALLVLEGWLLFQLMSHQGRFLLRLEALEAGFTSTETSQPDMTERTAPIGPEQPEDRGIPSFALASLEGETITLDALRSGGKPVMLVFSDPDCAPCTALLPELGRWQREGRDTLTLALISCGTREENQHQAREHGLTQVLLQQQHEVARAYQAWSTPSAVLIEHDEMLRSPLAHGAHAIRALIAGTNGLPALRTESVDADQGNDQGTLAGAGQPANPSSDDGAEQTSAPALSGTLVRLSEGPPRPLVSVVVVVYNGERYLHAAVKSVLEQTLKQIEIIIVNDGSTDSTEQIINALASDPRVRPVRQNHLGIARAKHTGIAHAQAKYIAFQDADDLSLPTRLEKQYRFLERSPDVGLVGSFVDVMNEAGVVAVVDEAKHDRRRQFLEKRIDLHEFLLEANCFTHGSVMMQKAACEAVGNYREAFSYAEDYDLWLRMAERYALGMLPEILYQYRLHSDNVSKKKAYVQWVQARIARELALERRQTGTDILQQGGSAAFFAKYGAELQAAEQADTDRESSRLLLSRRE